MIDKLMFKRLVGIILILIIIISVTNVIIDPYFHYHKPLDFLSYPIEYERYQNDGIVKHFDYDAIITGTSMAENFKTSELDRLFGVNSIKVPESGATYKEINNLLEKSLISNNRIKLIIRGLDTSRFFDQKDEMRYEEESYPNYLYNDSLLDDYQYILNKSTLFSSLSVIANTVVGNETTSFDEYSNWMKEYELGEENVNYQRSEKVNNISALSVADKERIKDNIRQNVTDLVIKNPNTDFYLFFTPYSICYFDNLFLNGKLNRHLDAEKVVIEELIKYDNVHLFSFFNDTEIITNLDNYIDIIHYGEDINSYILNCMKNGTNIITNNNYLEYCQKEKNFYLNFDYDSYFNK